MRVKHDDKAARSVSVDRLDDGSYLIVLFDGDKNPVRYSTNNIDLVVHDVKEFLKVSVPF